MRHALIALWLCAVSLSATASPEIEYRPGNAKSQEVWRAFYLENRHESAIDDPLITQGSGMVQDICAAIRHRDMKQRRYAIGALGYIGDQAALSTLESILGNEAELDYFRADALKAIYQINLNAGRREAKKYRARSDTLGQYAKAVVSGESWLLEHSKE